MRARFHLSGASARFQRLALSFGRSHCLAPFQGKAIGCVWCASFEAALFLFPTPFMEKSLPFKVNVAAQWLSGMLCVQVIEIAENTAQALMGGSFAIRVRLLGSDQKETIGFAVNAKTAKDLH